MSTPPKNTEPQKRSYHSPVRQQKAALTRERVMQAARRQLREKGYADISMEDVAKEAQVALQTVYRVCGSKKKMLEDSWKKLQQNSGLELSPPDVVRKDRKKMLYEYTAQHFEKQAAALNLLQDIVSNAEDDVERYEDPHTLFYDSCRQFIAKFYESGLLRPGLDVETAADIYWAMQSPALQERFMRRGWSEERFVALMYELFGMLLMNRAHIADVMSVWQGDNTD